MQLLQLHIPFSDSVICPVADASTAKTDTIIAVILVFGLLVIVVIVVIVVIKLCRKVARKQPDRWAYTVY